VESVAYLPTEIKDNALTVSGRVKVTFWDEEDPDTGIDPYYTTRSAIRGTFWKKLLARNPNMKGRPITIYEGFDGLTAAQFEEKWVGIIDAVAMKKGVVTIESIDLLKSLADIEVPPKLDIKLVADVTAALPTLTVNDVTDLDAAGYVRIDDEIIRYTSRNAATNQLLECTRGAFDTEAVEHSGKDKVQLCRYYEPQNPYDMLYDMLVTDAEIDTAHIDAAAYTKLKTWPVVDTDYTAIITEPTKLDKLYFELVKVLDCRSWVNEDRKITIVKNMPNEGARPYTEITDAAGIVQGSATVDLNDKSRISRVSLYWEMSPIGEMPGDSRSLSDDTDDVSAFSRLDIAIDADSESENEYDETIEEKIFCRWIRRGYEDEDVLDRYVANLAARYLIRRRDAMPILEASLELKDEDLAVGDFVKVTTDEIQETDGSDCTAAPFQVTRKERKGNDINVKLIKLAPKRICIIGPDTLPDFASAGSDNKEYGYISQDTGEMADGTPAYQIY